jgi:predicted amidophosphoribosyltransferase
VRAVASYDGVLREALVGFKDHRRWLLRDWLGAALARSVAAAVVDGCPPGGPVPQRIALVPVPGSPGSARERDGDHGRELARAAARVLRAEVGVATVVVAALVPVRRRRDQVGLDQRARRANLAASMAAAPSRLPLDAGAGTALVVVDDLVTTGATLAEAVRALVVAGTATPSVAVVAARELTGSARALGVARSS